MVKFVAGANGEKEAIHRIRINSYYPHSKSEAELYKAEDFGYESQQKCLGLMMPAMINICSTNLMNEEMIQSILHVPKSRNLETTVYHDQLSNV